MYVIAVIGALELDPVNGIRVDSTSVVLVGTDVIDLLTVAGMWEVVSINVVGM